jgi:2-hydroxy-3-keto-5-methylthiopentenyl-1-phosphate phosphatase
VAEITPIGAIVVDFDGTACSEDVVEVLLREFGDPSWMTLNDLMVDGAIGLREGTGRQAELLTGTLEEMLAFAVERCPLDPTFAGFVAWTKSIGLPMTIVSDGFGFYIQPILETAGLGDLRVLTNELFFDPGPKLRYPNGHPECVGCGTCKMLATQSARTGGRGVAFVGDGPSDRYGALYADITFAKGDLVDSCIRDGVPYVAWNDFNDVQRVLQSAGDPPGPVAPVQCPGWTPSPTSRTA